MSYVDVCCSVCRGDVVCLGCGEIDIACCKNCGAEVELPHIPPRETYDPEKVRALVRLISDGNMWLDYALVSAACAVQDSERKSP